MQAHDNVHQTHELTYMIGHTNACSRIRKLATYSFIGREFTVLGKGACKT